MLIKPGNTFFQVVNGCDGNFDLPRYEKIAKEREATDRLTNKCLVGSGFHSSISENSKTFINYNNLMNMQSETHPKSIHFAAHSPQLGVSQAPLPAAVLVNESDDNTLAYGGSPRLEVSRCSLSAVESFNTKSIIICFLLFFAVISGPDSAWAKLVIHSQSAVEIELLGYNGLAESSIFKGDLSADSKHEINTAYRGLALLVFAGGQRYPVIIGDKSFTLKIAGPGKPPSFAGSEENDFFYKSLSGGDLPPGQYDFALLMIQAQGLLESSQSIKTVKELTAKKNEFQGFVGKHYDMLKHSDMIKRLITQYFMMHEYVDYHTEGAPASDIRVKYQKAVLNGVGEWLETLKPHLPEQEILNYCVSLYYKRSMVTLASLIIEDFRDVAYCPGAEKETFSFPGDMLITRADSNKERKLGDFKGNKLIAFVSEDCPVSMVETISKVRQLAVKRKNMVVIVVPLQKLSNNHLAMARMVSNGKMLFVNDEKWRKANLPKQIKLPLFVRLGEVTRSLSTETKKPGQQPGQTGNPTP